VETEELGIAAGLQDRVIQCYEGMVYMDFDRARERMAAGLKCYHYEALETAWLPPLYVAYHDAFSEPTEVFHNDIRGRYNRGDERVVAAMARFAQLAAQGREALLNRDVERLATLINENFDTRRAIYNLPAWQVEMVETARQCGASAKFAGSGGAIIGVYQGEEMFEDLRKQLALLSSRVIKPQVRP
jgi:glucuronokinase